VELKTDWTPIIGRRGGQTIVLYSLGAERMGKGVYLFSAKDYSFAGNENRIKANSPGEKPLYITWPHPLQLLKVSSSEPAFLSQFTPVDLKPFEPSNESLRILATELGNEVTRYMKQVVLSTPSYKNTDWSTSWRFKNAQDLYERYEKDYRANGHIEYLRTLFPEGSPRDFLMAHLAKDAVRLEICKRGLEGELKSPNPTAAALAKQLIDQIEEHEKNPYAWELR
jgi:hypothetical protein